MSTPNLDPMLTDLLRRMDSFVGSGRTNPRDSMALSWREVELVVDLVRVLAAIIKADATR